jgi:hypothetical protein
MAIEDERAGVLSAMNEEQPLHGLFVGVMASHLKRLADEAARLARAREAQAGEVLSRALRVKRAERLASSAAAAERLEDGRKELAEMIDLAVGRASLP